MIFVQIIPVQFPFNKQQQKQKHLIKLLSSSRQICLQNFELKYLDSWKNLVLSLVISLSLYWKSGVKEGSLKYFPQFPPKTARNFTKEWHFLRCSTSEIQTRPIKLQYQMETFNVVFFSTLTWLKHLHDFHIINYK